MKTFRIRIAIVAVLVGFVFGWYAPTATGKYIDIKTIDGKIAECLK